MQDSVWSCHDTRLPAVPRPLTVERVLVRTAKSKRFQNITLIVNSSGNALQYCFVQTA